MKRLGATALVLAAVVMVACGGSVPTSSGTAGASSGSGGRSGSASTGASSGATGTGAATTAAGTGGATTAAGTGGAGATTAAGTGGGGAAGSSAASTGSGMGPGCTVTLSGAVTGSFACTATAAWSGDQNQSAISFTPASALPAGVEIAAGGGAVGGQLAVMAYAYSDFVKGGYAVTNNGQSVWSSGPDDAMGGPQKMTITSVKTTIQTTNGKVYAVHGTFDATCPWVNGTPDPGTTVTVHIDF